MKCDVCDKLFTYGETVYQSGDTVLCRSCMEDKVYQMMDEDFDGLAEKLGYAVREVDRDGELY